MQPLLIVGGIVARFFRNFVGMLDGQFGRLVTGLVFALLIGSAGFLFLVNGSAPQKREPLVVMSYASFAASWGPGPRLAKQFEERTGTPVRFVQADDAGVLLQRLKLVVADVVIGLDQFVLASARSQLKWHPHGLVVDFPQDEIFLPIDWAPVGFVYREGEVTPPTSLDAVLEESYRDAIALEDPRTSAPGFQFLSWIAQGRTDLELMNYIRRLRRSVQSISPSWSQAYGLFTRGSAKLVLSYMTSPLYHQVVEGDVRYRFAKFPEGHPVHVEFAGIPAACVQCAQAQRFLQFLISEDSQKLIMETNWMLPVLSLASRELLEPFRSVVNNAQELRPRDMKALEMSSGERERLFKLWSEASP